jgi:hypothetical protein
VIPDRAADKRLKDGYVPTAANAQALQDMNDTNVSDLDMVDLGNSTVYIEWAMGCQVSGMGFGRIVASEK